VPRPTNRPKLECPAFKRVFYLENGLTDSYHINYQGKNTPKRVKNKEERYSRVPRLSDTRYSAKGAKGKWRYGSSKAILKCAILIFGYVGVMRVRMGVANFFWINRSSI